VALMCSGMVRILSRLGVSSLIAPMIRKSTYFTPMCGTQTSAEILDTAAAQVCLNRPVGSWTAVSSMLEALGVWMSCAPLGPVWTAGVMLPTFGTAYTSMIQLLVLQHKYCSPCYCGDACWGCSICML
jgi:hypothetical protein